MKRTIIILTFVMGLVCACTKSVTDKAQTTLEVSFASDTKVYLDGIRTRWDAGDAVTVFYRSTTPEFWNFLGGTGDVSGQIGCSGLAGRNETRGDIFVLYPQDTDAVLEGNTIYTEIPAVQQYRKDSYGTALLASRSIFDILHLYYCTAMVELQYSGPAEISKVMLQGRGGEKIAGGCSICLDSGRPVLSCDGEETVTLDCNVSIQEDESASFYFSIAPGCFSEGLSLTVRFKDGTTHDVKVTEDVRIDAGHIYKVKAGYPAMTDDELVMDLLFSDGTKKNEPFTRNISFKIGSEIGPYYCQTKKGIFPFYMFCKEATEANQGNFRITNGGGLYIGGTNGDYITFPAVDGYRLGKVSVYLNKGSDFHISKADAAWDDPEGFVKGGGCTDTRGGEFRMLYLSGTESGVSYRMYIDNHTASIFSLSLYYCK